MEEAAWMLTGRARGTWRPSATKPSRTAVAGHADRQQQGHGEVPDGGAATGASSSTASTPASVGVTSW
eukprot:3338103-Pyramimonas_sp.AAC.1